MKVLDFKERELFEEQMKLFTQRHWAPRKIDSGGEVINPLRKPVEYALGTGGKRFRPALCFAAAKALCINGERILPFAVGVEWIHTYSLIHDDLPMMDDDDFRRGQPSTHKKFDEATALLAGDALLTESMGLVVQSYKSTPEVALNLVARMTEAAGARGMILGQMMDFYFDPEKSDLPLLESIHHLKTGRLIGLCFEGAALLAGSSGDQVRSLRRWGLRLGLAFQIKDDLLDGDEPQSFLRLQSVSATKALLDEISHSLQKSLEDLPGPTETLSQLVEFNQLREK